MTLDRLQEKYEDHDAQRASEAAAAAARALQQPAEEEEGNNNREQQARNNNGIPDDQRPREEDLGNFSYSMRLLRARGPVRKYVYRDAGVLELKREFVVGFINESSRASQPSLQALDELADVLDDDAGVDADSEEEELAGAWSLYAKIGRDGAAPGVYRLSVRFPSVMGGNHPTAGKFVEVELIISQFAQGRGLDDNRHVRAVKKRDGTRTADYNSLRRGPGSLLLDNVPSSFTIARVTEMNKRDFFAGD